MQIIIQEKTGGPEVLAVRERPTPSPAAGEVVVRVRAAGINPVDVAVRAGYYPLLGEPPFTVGWDISGEVVAVAPGVSGFAVGDEVFGMPRFPHQAAAYAEYVAAPAGELARKPASIDHAAAGALPLAGLTAWQGLVDGAALRAGEKVLVYGAAGGVGHLAVQIAKAQGAYVAASASGGKLDYLRSIGADAVADHATGDPDPETLFDVVFDPIAGAHAEHALTRLKPGGRLVCLLDPSEAARQQAKAAGKIIRRVGVRPDAAGLRALAELVERGALKVHVAKSFPLADAGEAQAFLGTKPIGKIVLTV